MKRTIDCSLLEWSIFQDMPKDILFYMMDEYLCVHIFSQFQATSKLIHHACQEFIAERKKHYHIRIENFGIIVNLPKEIQYFTSIPGAVWKRFAFKQNAICEHRRTRIIRGNYSLSHVEPCHCYRSSFESFDYIRYGIYRKGLVYIPTWFYPSSDLEDRYVKNMPIGQEFVNEDLGYKIKVVSSTSIQIHNLETGEYVYNK